MTISIQIVQTGEVSIRPTGYTQPSTRPVLLRRLRFLFDRTWRSENLPIYTFLITHPEGPILFDTGMSPHCNSPNYFPWWAPAIRWTTKLHIKPHEGIVSQLRERGIEPKDLKAVVISHLHHDHSGGMAELSEAPIFMSREHWERFGNRYFHAAMEGAAPNHYPAHFAPKFLNPVENEDLAAPFRKIYPITNDWKVLAVDTPGHVPGHISLIVFAEGTTYFLTGDATYDLGLLEREEIDGVNDDPIRAVESVRKIKEFARGREVVVLPSHDWESVKCLEGRVVFKPKDKGIEG